MLALAAELSRRGTGELWFATDDVRREEVESLPGPGGVRFASLGEVIPELSAVSWPDDVYREVTQRSRFKAHRAVIEHTYHPRLQAAKFRALADVVDRVAPELMVIESLCSFAVDVALTRGIPFVLSVPFLPSNTLTSLNPFAAGYTPRDFPVPHSGLPYPMSRPQKVRNELFKWRTLTTFLRPRMARLLAEDGRIREELGLGRPSPMTRIDRATMIICSSVAELDFPFPVPDKMKLVGPLLPPLPEGPTETGVSRWLDEQKSVVYMGFGTITRLTRDQVAALVEVAERLAPGHAVLWKLPREQQHLLPAGGLPANLRIESWVPSQLDVLAHPATRVFFTHGGGNGFHEGLAFGKPLVVRPLWVDCYDQAVRGEHAGVSLTVNRPLTVDPDDVTAKLREALTSATLRHNAERIGAALRAAGGRTAAADLICSLLAPAAVAR
jgi:polyene glycosyltransferase